ncbi:HotDog domain-containing protein [Aspergillus crustosus]
MASSSLPRSLSRILRPRKQLPSAIRPLTCIRAAQTEAAPSSLNGTSPPPHFHNAHANAHVQPHARQTPPPPTPPPTRTPKYQPGINANTDTATDPLSSHPLLHSLRANKSLKESRPHLTMPSSHRTAHLVAGSLSGPQKLTTAPYLFLSKRPSTTTSQTPESQDPHLSTATALFHPGPNLCGHPGFIHGGFLSVIFDEVFAHAVSQCFKSGTGMTANLNVDFRKPALPGRVYVLRARTVKVEGRKAWVEGRMVMLGDGEGSAMGGEEEDGGVVVAEGRALFVEPRFAESMVPVYRN